MLYGVITINPLVKLMAELQKFQETRKVYWLIPLVTGLIGVAVGITLMYLLPTYVISILNTTGIFTNDSVVAANTAVTGIQAIGFLVTMISLIWVIIGVVSAGGKGK